MDFIISKNIKDYAVEIAKKMSFISQGGVLKIAKKCDIIFEQPLREFLISTSIKYF